MLNSSRRTSRESEDASKHDSLRLSDTISAILGGRIPEPEDSYENDLPDLANLYLPPYPNPSRFPTVFQNASNSSTFEILFQFTPTASNVMLLICLSLCTIWVIVMNLVLIGALLKGHKYDTEHVTDMYLINLLCADVLLGVFVFPFMSIVILVGYFPLSALWCNIWVYFDYYLIISSSYGFAALMCSYLMIIRWPEYYPRSRRLHLIFICLIWLVSNAPWTAPFINDRVSVLYPKGVCGFSIKNNRYFTFYIGFTGFYIPLGIALIAGIFAVKYLKQSARLPFIRLLMNSASTHVHPFVPTSAETESSEFNNLYQTRRHHHHRGNHLLHPHHHPQHHREVRFNYSKPQQGLSSSDFPSESTTDTSSAPIQNKKRYSIINVKTFQQNKALQDSVKRHFPLVATSLILFVLSRSLFYTYFGIGAVVPKLFPPDLSHTVYWVMHSYAVAAPIVHLLLDKDLRTSVIRFINEGTFESPPPSYPNNSKVIDSKLRHMQHSIAVPKVSVIDVPRPPQYRHPLQPHPSLSPFINGNNNSAYMNKLQQQAPFDRGYHNNNWYYS